MKLVYSTDPKIALFSEISENLILFSKKKCVVFLCGGSTVKTYQYFSEKFDSFLQIAQSVGISNFSNLTFALTDDRWSESIDDENINFNQIENTGFYKKFTNLGASIVNITNTKSIKNDADIYNEKIKDLLKNEVKILIGGVGTNGHTCGIWPHADKDEFERDYPSDRYVVYESVDDKFSNRITLTPSALEKIDKFLLFISGEEKKEVISKLLYDDIDLYKMPSQIYKSFEDVKIFTDIV